MHSITGGFAEPSQELAFAVQLFRLAFPAHVLLLALILTLSNWIVLVAPAAMQAIWGTIASLASLSLVGRVLLHNMHDSVRSQRIGSWTWTVLLVLGCISSLHGFGVAPEATCARGQKDYLIIYPLIRLPFALINGSHGMSFAHKTMTVLLLLTTDLIVMAICGRVGLVVTLSNMGALAMSAVIAQLAELLLRRSYAERVQEKRQLARERQRLVERNEQLQAEKERLLYDVQRRGQPLHDDRNAVRRGLQARPRQPYYPTDSAALSEDGAPAPSESPPPSLPPSAPSSTGSSREHRRVDRGSGGPPRNTGKSTALPRTWVEAAAQALVAAHARANIAQLLSTVCHST